MSRDGTGDPYRRLYRCGQVHHAREHDLVQPGYRLLANVGHDGGQDGVVRVVDVRVRLEGGRWVVDELASVDESPVRCAVESPSVMLENTPRVK